jgi:RimJ/RimL family protein N-acetyltransferase
MPPFAETERLIFRPYKESDTPRLFQLMDDLRIRKGEPLPLAPNHPTFSTRIAEMVKSSTAWVRSSSFPHRIYYTRD